MTKYRRDPEKQKAYYKAWRKKHRKRLKEHRRKWSLAHAYQLSLEEYETMLQEQFGVCAICHEPETAKFKGELKRLCVDHDHKTGRIRGLLCTGCNSLLGHAKDRIPVLVSAVGYLAKSSRRRAC